MSSAETYAAARLQRRPAPFKMRAMANSILSSVLVVAGVLATLLALVYWRQDRFIFFPRPSDPLLALTQRANRVNISSGGERLEGWWVSNPHATTPAVILYFGGNGEDVLYTAMTAPVFNASSMLAVNYRGYGGSTGKPSQSALYEDALNIYDYAVRNGVSPEHIVPMGRSLGSSVAAMLAGQRTVGGAILVTPFDSLAAVGARHYPFLPVKLLLRHPFRSTEWAKRARTPALILAAEQDTIIPAAHSQRLFEAWAGEKEMHVLDAVGHNDIEMHAQFYELINAFLGRRFAAEG